MNCCPNCGKSVDDTTKFCTNCGTSLARERSETPPVKAVVAPLESHDSSIARSAPTASPSTTNRRVGRCKYCNKIIHVGDNPCPNCGHELNWKGQLPPKSSDTSQTTIPPNKEQGPLPPRIDKEKSAQENLNIQSHNSDKEQGGDPGFALRAVAIPLMIIIPIVLFAIFVNELDKWHGSPEIVVLVAEVFFASIPFVLSLAAYLSSRWRMQNKTLGTVCRGNLGLWSSILLAEGYWYGYYAIFLVIYKDSNIGVTRFCKYYDDDSFIWEVVLSLLVSFGLFFWQRCLRKQEHLASEEDQKRRFTNIG